MKVYSRVAVDVPVGDGVFTYESDFGFNVGDIVSVPMGKRQSKGCIVQAGLSEKEVQSELDQYEVKPHGETVEGSFKINQNDLSLYQWISKYYHYSLGKLIFDCLPKLLKRPREVTSILGEGKDLNFELTSDQQSVLKSIKSKNFNVFRKDYIHGVTGSGKTLVYLHLIKENLKEGKSVLFLLPEINLTPQFIKTFSEFLDCEVLSYHSGLNNSERYNVWKKLSSGDQQYFVMGVRSSVFLPLSNLGLVIVDEEHDTSFKQNDRCPYNGRDVAIKKAQIFNCPVILGSATPSIENFTPQSDSFHVMSNRVSGYFPSVDVVSTQNLIPYEDPNWPLAIDSIEKIKEAFEKGEQVLVFVSRLGFANFVQCSACGHQFKDPETETNLRYFKKRNILKSAHSNFQMPLPEICPECGNMNLLQKGFGTEKVQEVLRRIFPEKVIGRFDRDEISNFEELSKTLDDFAAEKIDLLVGTQMLSKGHNFSKVNTVIVLGIDSQLSFPDFRALERAYQLLVQVAGRAGRYSKSSQVIVQTLNPELPLFKYINNPAEPFFFDSELPIREITGFPPFKKIIALFFSSRFREKVSEATEKSRYFLDKVITQNNLDVEILGPSPVSVEKRAGQFTWSILLRSSDMKGLHQLVSVFKERSKFHYSISLKIDVDPYYYG